METRGSNVSDLTLTIGAEYGEALTGVRQLGQQYASEVAKFDKPIKTTVDVAGARKAIAGLSDNYKALAGSASNSADQQRSALAALAVAGQKGTAEYHHLLEETKLVIAEQKRLQSALADVDAELSKTHPLDINVEGSQSKLSKFKSFAEKAFDFNNINTAVDTISAGFEQVLAVGGEFEASLAAVGAITGQSGAQLDRLGASARELATTFGTSASDQLASYQGILSKLGAQVADTPAALAKIAENVNILSAASGDAASTSMSAIIDSMLQFGLVTGNSSKDAETSTRVINALAASAQVGAAEIPQVAEAILQAGVAAKGAKQSFEDTNAAIQVLALGGKTGSEAGIALRNVLGLLQKASGPAEETMRKLGTSSADLGKVLTEQGLDAAITKIKIGMNGLGSAAEKNAALMTIFGTENSAAAGILIDNVDKLKEFQQGIIAGEQGTGAAFDQAAVRMHTTEAAIRRAEAVIKDGLLSMFSAASQGLTSVVGASVKIVPLVQTLQGLKSIIPEGLFTKAASGLKDLLLPLLIKLGVVRVTGVATMAAETTGEIANAAAKGVQTVATEAATVAQGELNATMSINPVFLLVTGIAALGAAIVYFATRTKSVTEATDDAAKAADKFQQAQAGVDGTRKAAAETTKLTDEYDRLSKTGTKTADQQKRLDEITKKLGDTFPGTTETVDKFDSAGRLAGTTTIALTGEIRKLIEENKKLADQRAADALADLKDQTKELGEAIRRGTKDIGEMRAERDKLNTKEGFGAEQAKDAGKAILGGPVVGLLQYVGVIDTAEDKQKKLREEIAKQGPELDKAKQQAIANVELFKEQGFSAAQIAEQTGLTTDEVRKYHGELSGTLVASKTLEGSIAQLAPEQQKAVREAAALGEGYKDAQNSLTALQAKLATQKQINPNVDTKQLEAQIAEAEQKAADAKLKFDAFVDTSGVNTTLEKLPERAKIELSKLRDAVGDSLAETKAKIAQEDIGAAILKASEIKGELDVANKAQRMVDAFKAAKTDAERQQIGKVISDTMGPAVASYDALTGRVEVNIDKAQTFADTQKKAFTGDIVAQREKFAAGLKTLTDQYQANKEAADAAGAALRNNTDPTKVAELAQRWKDANAATEKTAGAITDTVEQGRKVGLVTGDVKEMGVQLGLSAEQGKNVAEANERISRSAVSAAADVKKIAAAYKETQQAAQDASSDNFGAVRGMQEELRNLQKLQADALRPTSLVTFTDDQKKRLAELPGLIAQAKADARAAFAESKRLDTGDTSLKIELGQLKVNPKNFADEAKKVRDEIAGIYRTIATGKITDDVERSIQTVKDNLTTQQTAITDRIKAIKDEVAKAKNDGDLTTTTENADKLIAALRDKSAALAADATEKERVIREAAAKKLFDLAKKQLADENKNLSDASKIRIEFLKLEEQATTDRTTTGILRRAQLRRQAADLQLETDIREAVASNDTYIQAYAELAQARAVIVSTTATDAEKAAARARLEALEQGLKTAEKTVLATDQRVALIRKRFSFERETDIARTSIDIFDKQTQERLSLITDEVEREYETKKAAIEKQLNEELEAAQDNEEAQTAAHDRATAARLIIDRDYQKKTNAGYALLEEFRDKIMNSFLVEDLERNRKEVQTKLDANLQQERDLKRSLLRRAITETEYNEQLRGIMRERSEIVVAEEAQKLKAIDYLNQGASAGLQTVLDVNAGIVDKSIKKYGEIQDGSKAITEGLGNILLSGAVQMAAITSKAAVEQKNIAKAAAIATLDIAITLLAHLIPIWIASLYGKSIETLGPVGLVLGAVAAGLAVTILSALKAEAEGATFHEGFVPQPGARRRERRVTVLENEATINPTATARNLELLRFINTTNEDAEVFFRNRVSRSVYGERVHGGITSPIVIVIQHLEGAGSRVDTSAMERRLDRIDDRLGELVAIEADTNEAADDAEFTRGGMKNELRAIRAGIEAIAAAPPARSDEGNRRRNLWR